jgi:GTP-binding protein HflX
LSVHRERAVLMGVLFPGDDRGDHEDPLEELARLTRTAGAAVLGAVTQRRDRPDPTYFLGKGKAMEVVELVQATRANVIIADNDLSPAQIRNLERIGRVKVVDRTELILDIFATRAKTTQAKLQVQLAQMEYMLPRLKRMWTHLESQEGGFGARGGPGEKQIEVDRRLLRKRIIDLRRELKAIEARKEREVSRRHECFQIGIVGYTNAGKSTLMNRLTDANVLVEDKLFSTLDTRTRVWQIAHGRTALLSDTVGFIQRLPHHLVASFHATLEEASQADLLLHIVDASHPRFERQIAAVEAVLGELGLRDKPQLLVFNKVDNVTDLLYIKATQKQYAGSVLISAKTGEGIDDLRQSVLAFYEQFVVEAELLLSAGDGKLLSTIAWRSEILGTTYEGSRVRLRTRIDRRLLNQLVNENGRSALEVASVK